MTKQFVVCVDCHVISCDDPKCKSPQPDCQEGCRNQIDVENVLFQFCSDCTKGVLKEMEKQFRRKELPVPKLHVEEDDCA